MTGFDRFRILIVENDGLVSTDMAATLGHFGYRVVGTCKTCADALRLYDDLHPDLVLIDVHLDGGSQDGIETARQLQQRGPVAVIYTTSCADPATIQRARATQPQGYLLKPFGQDELRLTLEVAATRVLEDQQRRRQECSYQEACESLADGILSADLAGIITFMNPAAARITGWKVAEAKGRSLHEVFRVYHANGEPAMVELMTAQHPLPERTVWLTTQAGERVPICDRATPLRDQTGNLSGVVLLFRPSTASGPAPITAGLTHHHAAAATAAAEKAAAIAQGSAIGSQQQAPAPLVDVVESISDPLVALDSRWRLIYANVSAQQLFERGHEKLIGISLWDLLPAATKEEHHAALAHALLHRQPVTRELFLTEKQAWIELRGYPFAEGQLILLQDITSKRQAEEQRNRLDRLESLGLLARGFAHEFNNLLTVLLGNLSLAEMRLRTAIQLPELHAAKQATLQAQGLVQQLLTFARGGAPIKRPIQLGELVEQFFQHHSRATRIAYRLELAPRLPTVAADPAQIRRLVGNLIRNAEQAQPNGGSITVRCMAPAADAVYSSDPLSPGDDQPAGVIIEVQDQGEGIPVENLGRIFEPYFSTRKAENATGLGLTVCESIAKAHGGTVSVRSENQEGSTGRGTLVRLYLPVDPDNDDVEAVGLPPSPFETAPPPAAPRILILEDDPLVRALIVRNLQSQGYDVTETPEGTETVRAYQDSMQQQRKFDLVILDLSIPNGMGGVRTMEKLRQMDPEVLAIVSSGYSDDPVMARPADYGFAAVLPKPYEPGDMIRLVKSIFNQRSLKK
jgi:two-component system, cell cycle sensor histidine kinase and response regulator CckA